MMKDTLKDNIKVSSLSKEVIYHNKKQHVSCNVRIDKDETGNCINGTEFVINIIFSLKSSEFVIVYYYLVMKYTL